MTHVMIDLETMGLLPGCAILSIGACVFDPLGEFQTVQSTGTFYQNIDLLSCVMAGLVVEPSTAEWWRSQDPKAAAALESAKEDLPGTLVEFSNWLERVGADQLWANGPMSDIAWLEEAYRRCSMKAPWVAQQGGHRRPRDYRTIIEAAELVAGFDRSTIPAPTVAHDALADARAQAVGVQMAFVALRRDRFPAIGVSVTVSGAAGDEYIRNLAREGAEAAIAGYDSMPELETPMWPAYPDGLPTEYTVQGPFPNDPYAELDALIGEMSPPSADARPDPTIGNDVRYMTTEEAGRRATLPVFGDSFASDLEKSRTEQDGIAKAIRRQVLAELRDEQDRRG